MNRSRITGDLVSQNNIFVDIANDRVGIGSTIPGTKLQLPDDEILSLGNSADLKLVHTTSLSSISSGGVNNFTIRQSAGSGFLFIHGDQLHLRSQSTNEPYLTGVNNGAVTLYYDNSEKFKTTSTGATVTGALVADQVGVGDNESVYVGGSSDLQMYHDASGSVYGTANSSYIKCQGVHDNILDIFTASATGKIRLKSNNLAETMLVANGNGNVQLYNDNVIRFNTTATGVTVHASADPDLKIRQGGSSSSGSGFLAYENVDGNGQPRSIAKIQGKTAGNGGYGDLIFQTAFNNTLSTRLTIGNTGTSTFSGDVTLTDTTADANAGPELKLFRNSASPADADYLGQIKFAGENDNNEEINYAKITGKILDASDGTEDGILEFAHIKAGSQTITGRWRSDSLQLLNSTNFSVAGTSEFSDLATFTKSGSALRLNDGSILRLGNADADFFLYHDGSSTDYISAGTGRQLRLTTDDFIIKGANNTETLMTAAKDGAVQLYHDNNLRLATAGNGVNITGYIQTTNKVYSDELVSYTQSNSHSMFIKARNAVGTEATLIKATIGGAVELYHNTNKKFETTSSGADVTGRLMTDGVFVGDGGDNDVSVSMGANNDLRLYHDGSHSYIKDRGTGNLYIQSNHVNIDTDHGEQMINCIKDGAVELFHDNTKMAYTSASGFEVTNGNLLLHLDLKIMNDDRKLIMGAGQDFKIFHDGSHSKIVNTTGDLKIQGTASQAIILRNGDDTANVAVFNVDDATHLYHDSAHKFSTTSTGIKVVGNCLPNSNDTGQLGTSSVRWQELNISDVIDISDNGKIRIGNGDDLQLYHDSSNSFMQHSGTGSLYIDSLNNSADIYIRSKDNLHLMTKNNADNSVVCVGNGGVLLYHQGNQKFETTSSGASVSGTLNATNTNITTQMYMPDNGQIRLGNSDDLIISHNGTDSIIHNNTGALLLQTDGDFKIEAEDGGKDIIHGVATGACEIHYDGGRRIETTSTGAKITGVNGSNPTLQIEHSNVDTEGEVVRIERMVQPTIRYHSIKSRHSGSTNNNHIAFHVHSADNTTAQTEALKILGSGNLTYSQQAMTILVNPTDESTINENDNDDPIHFDTTYVNKGGMTVSESISRITVPLSGTYLLTGCISGSVTNESQGDGIQLSAMKNGSNTWYDGTSSVFPIETFGTEDGMEYAFTFSIPTVASANDYFEMSFFNLGGAVGNASRGYFSVTKLH